MDELRIRRASEHLLQADECNLPPADICSAIVQACHEVAIFDHCALMTTDPDTMLPSGGVVEGFEPQACAPFWDAEIMDPDFLKFADLARSHTPIATLFDTVDGDLDRSPRYRKIYAPLGATDELRAAFVAGASCLAVGAFLRPAGMGPFTGDEVAAVQRLMPLATHALRRSLGRLVYEATQQAPVVIVLNGRGEITGMTTGGRQVLEDLRTNEVDIEQLPGIVLVAAMKARWRRSSTTLTTRVRGRSGRWLRLHVSPMEHEVGAVAITVETAHPDDMVPILLESYGLTARETDIALLLCRGLSAKEIAAELVISPHTVRDHVKAIYEKADVGSRGALVARLFSGHLLERFHASVTHVA